MVRRKKAPICRPSFPDASTNSAKGRKSCTPCRHNYEMDTIDLNRLTQEVGQRTAALVLYARQWVDAATAEDVVQEALAALYSELSPPASPVAWMYRVVRNAAIDHARAASRRRRRERTVARSRGEWFDAQADALLDAQVAERALRQLSAKYREVVVLRIWGDLGFTEIAAIMKLGVSTATASACTCLTWSECERWLA